MSQLNPDLSQLNLNLSCHKGFLLGVVQMFQWMLFPHPWSLPIGGALVGYVTNWIALKMIFEPLNPVKVVYPPFVLLLQLHTDL